MKPVSALVGLIFHLLASSSLATDAPELSPEPEWRMLIGQARDVLGAGGNVRLTRRGVVDVFSPDDGKSWRVTALRRGFVILSLEDENGRTVRRYRIQVEHDDQRVDRENERSLPEWICAHPGVRCESKQVLGRTNDASWVEAAKRTCERSPGCRFAVRMEPQYRLRARLYAISDDQAEASGLSGVSQGSADLLTGQGDFGWDLALRNLLTQKRATIVGEPTIRLSPGTPAKIRSGGEFSHLTRQRDDLMTTEWKPYGLSLTATAWPITQDEARLTLDVELTSRPSGEGTRLANFLSTELRVPLGRPLLAGIIETRRTGSEESSSPWIASLPILGPLFRVGSSEESTSKIYVWIELRSDALDLGEGFQGSEPKAGDSSD